MRCDRHIGSATCQCQTLTQMHGLGRLPESRTARSPFMVLNSLQHGCLTRCRPVFAQCRHTIGAAASSTICRQKLRHPCSRSSTAERAYTVTCHASAALADPTVTGQDQQNATASKQETNIAVSSAYPFADLEAKWQQFWAKNKTFRTPDFTELDTSKPKFYALDMFPYPRSV